MYAEDGKDARLLREVIALVPWQVEGPVAVAPGPTRSLVTLPVRGPRQSCAYRVAHLVDRRSSFHRTDNSFHPKQDQGPVMRVGDVVLVLEPTSGRLALKDRVFVDSGFDSFDEVREVCRQARSDGSTAWETGCGTLVVWPCDPNRAATWQTKLTVALEGWSGARLACDSNDGVRVVVADLDARSR
tara:strand:+ start:589 stop:1146 length:558 start_codon:yes stop_codon:yes gene_type:complete